MGSQKSNLRSFDWWVTMLPLEALLPIYLFNHSLVERIHYYVFNRSVELGKDREIGWSPHIYPPVS